MSSPDTSSTYDFPPFRLDLRAGQLQRDGRPVPLRPKTFAVLQYLIEHRGELATKDALLDAIWGDVVVSDSVVRISVGELREALGDGRGAPRFIETVTRRGYRFIASVVTATGAPDGALQATPMVGRVRERAQILEWIDAAAGGRRQVVFVSGEAGIGKTTLVDAAFHALARAPARVARGQCVEHYGSGQPYLPVLEAIDALRRGPSGPATEDALRAHAPEWLLRVLGVAAPPADALLGSQAAAPESALHGLAACLDGLAADRPLVLVLVLEDVQWIDHSTLDLVSLLAQRRQAARLTVLCTLRPAEAIASGHPVASVKRELLRKRVCRELTLSGLGTADVASYLAARFAGYDVTEELLPLLVDRSDGNPFFIVALVDHLVDRGHLREHDGRWQLQDAIETLRTVIPDGLRAVVEPRLERLAREELAILEAASAAGLDFAVDVVARVAAPPGGAASVERFCDALVRRQEFLREKGSRYEFRHALYQQVIYQRMPSSERRRLHQAIGEELETTHAGRTEEMAAELAAHYERSRDVDRAVRYRAEAAGHARSRFAYAEVRAHLQAALALLDERPESPDRLRRQVSLLQELGVTLFALEGWGDEDGARAFARMRELAARVDGGHALFQAMEGQLVVHTMRAELAAARALGAELIVLAEQLGNDTATANVHVMHSATLYILGEVDEAVRHAERGRALFDADAPALPADVGILSCVMMASNCAYLGQVIRARAFNHEALTRAAALDTPFHRALATNLTGQVFMVLNDVPTTRSLADEALGLSERYDFSALRLTSIMLRAWCDVEDGRIAEGVAALRRAFAEYATTGQRYGSTSFSMLLARAHLANGDPSSAHDVVDASLRFAHATGERANEPELLRLRAECLVASPSLGGTETAAQAFERAVSRAEEMQGWLYALRAATGLCRIAGTPARARLQAFVDRIDDGADLRAARAVLASP